MELGKICREEGGQGLSWVHICCYVGGASVLDGS